jgi:hypothetical protein
MKLLIAVLFLLASAPSLADTREWTTEEQVWGTTAGVLLLSDWATTRDMTHRYAENYREINPLLGAHPSAARVNLHFLIAIPVVYLLADQMPEHRKEILQAVSAVELFTVGNNLRIGLRFRF